MKTKINNMKTKVEENIKENIIAIESLFEGDVAITRYADGKYKVTTNNGDLKHYSTKGKFHNNYKPKSIKTPSQGLGDTIDKITTSTGIKALVDMFTPEGKDCGCGKRKDTLNRMFPYSKPNCMNEEQYDAWTIAKKEMKTTDTISVANQDLVIVLVRDIHNMAITAKGCKSCSASVWKRYIDMIDKVYETYEN
tara:strand:- start:7920 stop:8501 length:582 start_codon:yes stop_codon:yes gene_type:complete